MRGRIRRWLCATAAVLIAGGAWNGCRNFEFDNPVDVRNTLKPPVSVSVSVLADSLLLLRWTDQNTYTQESRPSLTYEVERAPGDTSVSVRAVLAGDSTSAYLRGSFKAAVAYSFRIRIVLSGNASEYSTPAAVNFSFAAPSAPVIVSIGEHEIKASWTLENPLAGSVEMEVSEDGGAFKPGATIRLPANEGIVPGVFKADRNYAVRLRAVSAFNSSAWSPSVSSSFAYPAPDNLWIESGGASSCVLHWSIGVAFSNGFIVERSVNGGGYAEIARPDSLTRSAACTGLDPASVYRLRVRAFSDYNESANSGSLSVSYIIDGGMAKRTLRGHTSGVLSVAFTPDGTRIVSGSTDNTLRIWDAAAGTALSTLTGHSGWVNSVAVNAAGTLIASASNDKTVKLWRMSDYGEQRTFSGHVYAVYSIAFSPDGIHAASGSVDKSVRIWNIGDGSSTVLTGHSGWVNVVGYNPSGTILASGGDDNVVRLWNTSAMSQIRILGGQTKSVWAVPFSPDGATVAGGSYDGTIKLWRTADGSSAGSFADDSSSVNTVQFSPDGRHIASGNAAAKIKIRTLDGLYVRTLAGHKDIVNAIAFSPDGTWLASASSDNSIILWQLQYRWVGR